MEPLLVRALRREPVERTPVWFMRQAGRSLPEYRALRERHGFFELAGTPELCAEVTLQPVRRHGVDAAVMFADIMSPVLGMGLDVQLVEGVGPVVEQRIESAADVERLEVRDPEDWAAPILEAVRIVRAELEPERAVIGFCGGPFTVAGYLVEGKPSRDFVRTKSLMYREPAVWHALMERLADQFSRYVAAKAAAGADAIQLFDSWVGVLSVADYAEFVAPYSRRVLESAGVPTIHFGTGVSTPLLAELAGTGGDAVGLDWRTPLDTGWEVVGEAKAVQGNLEPAVLLAPWDRIEAAALDVLRRAGGRPGHVFNLGHGVLPQTDPDTLSRLAELVRRLPSRRMNDAVVLMAYGSPERLADVPAYYSDIRGGRPIAPEHLEDLVERYRRLGIEESSPLNAITEQQRAALEHELGLPVFTGMKHWTPRIADAAEAALAAGADRIVGLVLAPHYSTLSIAGYREQLEQAVGGRAELVFVESWHDEPGFVELLAGRVRGTDAHVVFTAHSLPERILAMGDPYRDQLLETSRLVAAEAGLQDWSFSFQSESPTGEPWLGPDILDHLEALHGQGVEHVLVCPVGFVSDHLEIRWDIDVEAQEKAAELGLELERIEMPNADPPFVRTLAAIARRALGVPSAA